MKMFDRFDISDKKTLAGTLVSGVILGFSLAFFTQKEEIQPAHEISYPVSEFEPNQQSGIDSNFAKENK